VIRICHQVKNCTNRRRIFSFCKISRKYQNSAAKGKFRGSAPNFTARGKLWDHIIIAVDLCWGGAKMVKFCVWNVRLMNSTRIIHPWTQWTLVSGSVKSHSSNT